jgi:hypothetical protein
MARRSGHSSWVAILAAATAVSLWLFAAPVSQAQAPLPLSEYQQLLADSQAIVADLGALSPEAQAALLDRLAGRWDSFTAVALPDNQQLPIDNGYILDQLRARPPDAAALQGLFAGAAAALQEWPPPRHAAADLTPLADILARPEFDWREPEPTLWQRLRDWLLTQLFNLLEWVFGRGSVPQLAWLNWLIAAAVLLLLAAILLYVVRRLRTGLTPDANLNLSGQPGDETLSADDALRRAQALSQQGDQRTAVRYLYLSALLLLEERGLLRYDRTQTNREYLRSVAHRPDLAAILREVVEIFDSVWYGFQPIDDTAVAHYTARVAELRRLPAAQVTSRRSDETV